MPAEFEAQFFITVPGAQSDVGLLREVTERLQIELASNAPDGRGVPDVETGHGEVAGYTRISAERDYPSDPPRPMRLEVRLCASEGQIRAEMHSRFLSTAEAPPQELLAGPPRLLELMVQEYQCSSGSDTLALECRNVGVGDAESFARDTVLNPDRRLPIVALTRNGQGHLPIEPDSLQRTLLGIATVALLDSRAAPEMTRHLSRREFIATNGYLQVLWPGIRSDAGKGNGPQLRKSLRDVWRADTKEFLREMQQLCLENAPETDFDSAFNDARTSVIFERNRVLEMQQSHASEADGAAAEELAELKRELRKERQAKAKANRELKAARGTVARQEQELAEALDAINALKTQQPQATESQDDREATRKLRADIRDLRDERDKLQKTNNSLNEDNQNLRQRLRQLTPEPGELRLAFPHPGYVTLLNYALNLYRDPMRRYITDRLSADTEEELKEILRQSIDLSKEPPERNGGEIMDVNNFHDVVNSNSERFADVRNLSRTLNEIRFVRNRAAHPPPGGVTGDFTYDGLVLIAEALEAIGANAERMEVTGLRERISFN